MSLALKCSAKPSKHRCNCHSCTTFALLNNLLRSLSVNSLFENPTTFFPD